MSCTSLALCGVLGRAVVLGLLAAVHRELRAVRATLAGFDVRLAEFPGFPSFGASPPTSPPLLRSWRARHGSGAGWRPTP